MKITDVLQETVDRYDRVCFEINDVIVETGVIGLRSDGIVLLADDTLIELLEQAGATFDGIRLNESKMAEADMIMQDMARGEIDIAEILHYPNSAVERYISEKLKEMAENISADYGLDLDNDEPKIMSRIQQELQKQYADRMDETLSEAEYQGRKVPLGKPMAGDVKKSKVYVKGPKGNVVKVNFGDKKMKIKKSNPKRRKSFRARHNCDNPGPRWKARYWSCRAW